MQVAIAKKVGAASVIAVEPNEKRSAMASEMGADHIVNPISGDPVTAVRHLTGDAGVDIVIEVSGSVPAIQSAISYVKPEGKITAIGLPSGNVDFNYTEFAYRGITLKGIAGRRMYQSWMQMAGLLKAGLDLERLVTHTVLLEEYQKGLDLMKSGDCCKAVINMELQCPCWITKKGNRF